jgi:hydroxyacylglutathione hydrolase
MFFRQVLHEDLGCASYIVASGGEAVVIDPKWEIDDYLEIANEHSLRIAHILETHNHADHLSGRGRLAEATGAGIGISGDADVGYDHEALSDGDAVELGEVRIVARAAPGHRPEHMVFVVEDRERGEAPWILLSGDSLFVGDTARPDLAVEPEEGARGLFRTFRSLRALDDSVELWPGHIGGSMCGGAAMSEKPGSTIGFERDFNAYFAIDEEDRFVSRLTDEVGPQPPNFERIVELNRGPLITESVSLAPLAPSRVRMLLDDGAVLVDGREPFEYDGSHAPGSINVTALKTGVGTRAAWVIEPDREVVLTAASDADAAAMARMLEAVGFRRIRGYLAGGIAGWRGAGLPLESTPAIDVPGLAERLRRDEVRLLDVRESDEWGKGHVPGSLHVPYYELRDEIPDELRNGDRPVAVACSAGNRSSVAASLLRRAGVEGIEHVAEGGVADLADAGIALEKGDG